MATLLVDNFHQMTLFSPDASFDLAIAANSGWYTLPVTNKRFPYGLSDSPIENKTINASFKKNNRFAGQRR